MKMRVSHLLSLLGSIVVVSCSDSSGDSAVAPPTAGSGNVAVNDPSGSYKLFSDPSITSAPAEGYTFGKGQVVEIKYDGSKGGTILSYQLFYVDQRGSVHPMTGGTFESKGEGVYSSAIQIFNSNADKRPGFMEVTTVVGGGMQDGKVNYGKNVTLGMYAVQFEVAE